jgi:hypothetical protein
MGVKLLGDTGTYDDSRSQTDLFVLNQYLCTKSGVIRSLRIDKGTGSGNLKLSIYEQSGVEPGALIWSDDSGVYIGSSVVYVPVDVFYRVEVGQYIWLGYNPESSDIISVSADLGNLRYKSATYSSFTAPNPAGSGFSVGTKSTRMSLWGNSKNGLQSLCSPI